MGKRLVWLVIPAALLAAALGFFFAPAEHPSPAQIESAQASLGAPNAEPPNPIVQGARDQLKNPAKYSGRYYKIDYPMGDVPANRGACTDVVIRALRKAGLDLQEAVQKDANETLYPRMLVRDTSIDHRRCPNLMLYFSRHGQQFPTDPDSVRKNIQPGDIVFWKLPGDKDHVGIASNVMTRKGHPFIIHNVGPEVTEADVLFDWEIVGHFRMDPAKLAQ
ncbi:MAG: DUF1287 domain-containing protein [Armatimonadetes bacterium]|nr:DUF1287 domain-containing protein [Armatimonadota bacterium]MBX3107789.1 DUF1287 domain-containing protein [Fimbriimonadaceae bacterium]